MANIGYLEGTDPELLDQLAAQGHHLIPLSTSGDGYGKKNWALISVFDSVDLVIAHYYQLKRTVRLRYSSLTDMLAIYDKLDTEVALVAPSEIMAQVRLELEEEGVEEGVKLAVPEKLFEAIGKLLDE